MTRDVKSAFQYYRKAAKLDHVESLVKCGDFIYSGVGMPGMGSKANYQTSIKNQSDKMEAFKCYKKASEQGNVRAMNNLGLMLERGSEGIPADPERASNLFKEAHKLGDADASVNLAMFYLSVSTSSYSFTICLLIFLLIMS